MTYRRMFALLGLALTGCLLMGGCGPSGSQDEEGVLRVWATWGDSPAQLPDLFERASQVTGLPVQLTTGVDSEKVLKALAGPMPPDLVVLSSSDLVSAYYEQGLLEPLDSRIEATGIDLDDIYAAALERCTMPDGTRICLPWGCDIQALFWNKDLFRAAGLDPERPPQTMEELAEYADKLTLRDQEGEINQIGFVPDYARSNLELYARMLGGSWYSDNGTELTVNSQPLIDAAGWQRQFYSQHGTQEVEAFVSSLDRYRTSRHPSFAGKRLSCPQCHPGTLHKKSPDRAFYVGRVAMMVAGEWQVGPSFIAHLQPELSYGVAPFPPPAAHPERAHTTVIEGPVVLIPAGARDKEAAARLLAWMVSPEIQAGEMYSIARLPSSRTAARDARFQQIPHFDLFMDLMAHANARHTISTPISQELNETLRRLEAEVLLEQADPVALLDELQAEFAPKWRAALAHQDAP